MKFLDVYRELEEKNEGYMILVKKRKITDEKLLWLLREIIYSNEGKTGLAIRQLYITSIC